MRLMRCGLTTRLKPAPGLRQNVPEMARSIARAIVPHGLLDIREAQRTFARLPAFAGHPLRAAARPQLRSLARMAHIDVLPTSVYASPRLVVDVGAYIGDWTWAVLRLLRPERLVAIEPSPRNFERLERRVGSRPEVTLERSAVGASSGSASLRLIGAGDLDSVLPIRTDVEARYGVSVQEHGRVDVNVVPLDQLLGEVDEVSLLKLDVQGSEREALAGAERTLRRTRCIVLETNFVSHYVGDALFPELLELMRSVGFELHAFGKPLHTAQEDGRLLFADAVFMPRHSGVN
jgi:FkbM family methyltransferase